MTRAGVITSIQDAIGNVSTPVFAAVYVGEPLSIPTVPCAAFWLTNHREDFETLGDSSTTAEFVIRLYWRMQTSANVRETVEAEMWDAVVAVKTELRGDSNLGGNATDSKPGDASFGYLEISGNVYRTATIPLNVYMYGESDIDP